ncbi:MAG: formylglycine-generating enzyme family protein, partial [Planctomycetota bacterium]|nr:formylglycine-generating enzyme family protein [Planctomycetota bacterium]
HYGVQLSREDWDRLITWIDLNCPFHGTWGEELAKPGRQRERRRELLKLYANVDDDPEAVPTVSVTTPLATQVKHVVSVLSEKTDEKIAAVTEKLACPGWPFDAGEARRRQEAAGPVKKQRIDLGNGLGMNLVLIPAGKYISGSGGGSAGEREQKVVNIGKPFWMGSCEVTNQQFARFMPGHDSRVETKNAYQFGIHGYPMNRPWQPVVRVSWQEAEGFCRWFSEKTGRRFRLPSEDQWEYACRAGSHTPLSYGGLDTDFSKFANMSDAKMTEFVSDPYTVFTPLVNPPRHDDWIPKDARFNDGVLLTAKPGSFRANAWGLFDMHGNVAEWTQSVYGVDPYRPIAGADAIRLMVVRGGSWRDRPKRCTSAFRLGYRPYQRIYNVGFRVVCEEP